MMKKLTRILSRRGRDRSDNGKSHPGGSSNLLAGVETSSDYQQLNSRRGDDSASSKRTPKNGTSRIVADVHVTKDRSGKDSTAGAVDSSGKGGGSGNAINGAIADVEGDPHVIEVAGHAPCDSCKAIDFPRLLAYKPGDARPWVPLAHALRAADDAECPYCVFFQAMIGEVPPSVDTSAGAAPASATGMANGDGNGTATPEDVEVAANRTAKFTPYLRIRQAFERMGISERHELGRSVLFEVTTRNRTLPWGYLVRAIEPPSADEADDAPPKSEAQETDIAADPTLAPYLDKSPAAPAISGRSVTPLLDPALPNCWLRFCRENHPSETCGRAAPPVPGLRLIDCQTGRVICVDELPEEEKTSSDFDYLALSYFSGDEADTTAAADGEKQSTPVDLSLDKLPPLFADAVSLTASLGFRYLWTDRYCLPADGPSRWRHSSLIGTIFSSAALAIVVASGQGVADGIPGVSLPREDQLSLKTAGGLFTTSLRRPDLEVATSRWANRAWTLQEGLLARRRLVLTPSQAYFQCRTLHCHETISLPLGLAPSVNLGRVFPADGAGSRPAHIVGLIKTFMTRPLREPAARLDAFRGILDHFSGLPDHGVEHLFGLPLFHPSDFSAGRVVSQTDRLAVALGWMPDRNLPSQDPVDPYALAPESPFPSWTWLSWLLQPGQAPQKHTLRFSLLDVSSSAATSSLPLVDGVSAPPRMEISVGFRDSQTVLSWEIDGDAIARRHAVDPVAFLRLETFCFDLVSRSDGTLSPGLGAADRVAVSSWLRSAGVDVAAADTPLTGVLVSGRGWRDEAAGGVATVLVCRRKEGAGDDASPLVRLGVLRLAFAAFVPVPETDRAVVRGVVGDEKGDISVRLREVDIY